MSYDTWIVRKLGEVTINHDKKRIPLSTMERTNRKGKYPYYGAQGIIDYIDDYIFEGRYLLIAEDGANLQTRSQDIASLTSFGDKFWVNNHAHILSSNELSDIRYIMYYLNHYDISGYITGSAQPKLNQTNLNSIEINLPPFQEQKTIANILSSLDDKIELNNKINKNLEELAQTLYKRWFVDFEFPNEEGEPYKSSGGEMIDSELGLIPSKWKILFLKERFEFERGVEPGSKNYKETKETDHIPFFRVGDLVDNKSVFIHKDLVKNKFVNQTDVLVSFDGAIGRVATGYSGAYSTGMRKIYDKSGEIYTDFIYFLFKSDEIQNKMTEHANGTTILHAGSSIDYLKTPYNKEITLSFQKLVRPIFKRIISIKNENIKLVKTREILLPKLMSGEIEVPNE